MGVYVCDRNLIVADYICSMYDVCVSAWLPSLHVCLEKYLWVFGFVGVVYGRGFVNVQDCLCEALAFHD